jgi:ketosteroid isomerase-like protein
MERAYAALDRRDLDAFLEMIDPDAEFTSLIAEAEGETFRGHEGVREWWDKIAGAMGGLEFRVEDFRDLGVGGVNRLRVSGTVGGAELVQTMYQAIRVKDGKAVWWRTFRTEEEALSVFEGEK